MFFIRHGLNNLDLRLVRSGLLLVLEHTSSFHEFVSNPVGKLVFVQLVRKQFLDVVVEKVGEDFVVEADVVV